MIIVKRVTNKDGRKEDGIAWRRLCRWQTQYDRKAKREGGNNKITRKQVEVTSFQQEWHDGDGKLYLNQCKANREEMDRTDGYLARKRKG